MTEEQKRKILLNASCEVKHISEMSLAIIKFNDYIRDRGIDEQYRFNEKLRMWKPVTKEDLLKNGLNTKWQEGLLKNII